MQPRIKPAFVANAAGPFTSNVLGWQQKSQTENWANKNLHREQTELFIVLVNRFFLWKEKAITVMCVYGSPEERCLSRFVTPPGCYSVCF